MEASALPALLPALRPLATADAFDEQVALCAQVAVGRKAPSDASKIAAASGTPSVAQDALVSLFLEAARVGVSADDLASALGSVLPEERARTIASLASDGQRPMRQTLDALNLGPDELVDVQWQRASIAAAGHERPRPGGTPLYTVTLTTRAANGTTTPIQFTATSEDLTDLVRELKCAMRQCERELA